MVFQEYTWFVLSLLAFPWYVVTLDKALHFSPGIFSLCQGNISEMCRGNEGKSVRWLFVYTLFIRQLRRTEADLYNSPYLACKKITFQLLPLCYDICWACRCLTQAWGEVQGVKIKDVLSPSDSNSTGPTGQASNVGINCLWMLVCFTVVVDSEHRHSLYCAELIKTWIQAEAVYCLCCIQPGFCWCERNFWLISQWEKYRCYLYAMLYIIHLGFWLNLYWSTQYITFCRGTIIMNS